MSKRAERRHHYQRLKKKVELYYGGHYENGKYVPWDNDRLGCIVETRPACSCPMCCNPRHNPFDGNNTIQERKAFQDSIGDLINEYYEEKDEDV